MPATKKKSVKKKTTAKSTARKKAPGTKGKSAAGAKAAGKKTAAKNSISKKASANAKVRPGKGVSAKGSRTSNGKTKDLVALGKAKAVLLAKEKKGVLTFDDLGEILPATANAEQIDEVMITLNNMDVKIVDELRQRSEERRVGKECRARWSPDHEKKKKKEKKRKKKG